jgi:uncharacterized membrane protein
LGIGKLPTARRCAPAASQNIIFKTILVWKAFKRLETKLLMNKTRLENFSDGVFSIAATLLILNIKIPDAKHINNAQLNHFLNGATPHLITFAFSFLVLGVFWVAHHRIFSFVEVPNRTLLWLNIVYLLFIALVPLPASVLSENPFLPTAILFYTVTLLIIAMMHFILMEYTLRNRHIKHQSLTEDVYRSSLKTAAVGPICYILAAACSFFNVYISFCFIIGAMVYYIFFGGKGKIEDTLIDAAKEEHR